MKKMLIFLCVCAFVGAVWPWGVRKDRETLNRDLIRLHVVANSDDERDQSIKLAVRDAVLQAAQPILATARNAEEAKTLLKTHLAQLEAVANRALEAAGSGLRAVVTLGKEAFATREYDTFSLPAGVYESLRVTIGEGEGKNWWCVVFPSLCLPAGEEAFSDTAAGAGFSEELTDTLKGEKRTKVRFLVLDLWGWVENFFF